MLKGLLKSGRWPIGLDIGTASIKMLQLQRSGQIMSVTGSGEHWLSSSIPQSGAERRKAVVAGIREILDKGKFAGRRAVSSLSSSQLSIKNVRMAHMPEDQLAQAIRVEACERFNFEVGPDQLRWINAGQVRQGNEVRDEIVMMAASAAVVEEHLALLDEAGLAAEHIEAEPVALFRVFQHFLRRRDDEQAVTVIVDIGNSGTRISVARGTKIVFIKLIDVGGFHLTDGVAKQLNLSHEEAHDLRVRIMKEHSESGGRRRAEDSEEAPQQRSNVDWTIRDAMRGQVEELAKEVALCLRYCSVTFRGLHPNCVVLTGGEAYDAALVELLSENLGVNCVVGRPLRGIDVSRMDVAANRRGTLADWALCTGLAMTEMPDQAMTREDDHAEHRLSA